jgi:predicted hydrocarbon binding protein
MMPNRGVRAILLELEQLLGKNGLGAVLKMAGIPEWKERRPADDLTQEIRFRQLAAIYRALEELYGERSARGLMRQANYDAFLHTWVGYGLLAALETTDFQDITLDDRLSMGCKALSRVFSEISDLDITYMGAGNAAAIHLSHCPDCTNLESEKPACTGMLGFLEGALSVILPGEHAQVQEVECMGAGDDRCVFNISVVHPD